MPALSDDELLKDSPFTRLVGERLRRIRQQKQWSLSDVEARSDSEFKASVLGAYERGERAISVPRLERLARFYGVSIDQLLPRDSQRDDDGGTAADGAPRKLRIDVAKLSTMVGQQFEMLDYLKLHHQHISYLAIHHLHCLAPRLLLQVSVLRK